MAKVNNRLKAKIIEHHGTQEDFAEVIKTDSTVVSRIVRGRRKLSEENKRIWSLHLKTPSEYLFD